MWFKCQNSSQGLKFHDQRRQACPLNRLFILMTSSWLWHTPCPASMRPYKNGSKNKGCLWSQERLMKRSDSFMTFHRSTFGTIRLFIQGRGGLNRFLTFSDPDSIKYVQENIKITFDLNNETFTDSSITEDWLLTSLSVCVCVWPPFNYTESWRSPYTAQMMDIKEHHHWFLSALKKPPFHHAVVPLDRDINAASPLTCFFSCLWLFPF